MNRQFENAAKMVDGRLGELMRVRTPELLWRSMEYSVSAGGKRLRPALNIMAAELMGGDPAETLDMAAAIEMIHTYSLIHDDLPALDNDELRRGRPTNHIVFGEAQAVLAGDGLLNYAYEVMLQNAMRHRDNIEAHMSAISIVAHAAGVDGMIAGQVVDVESEGRVINKTKVDYIHSKKTGAMITGALLSGVELFSPTPEEKGGCQKIRGGNRAGVSDCRRCTGCDSRCGARENGWEGCAAGKNDVCVAFSASAVLWRLRRNIRKRRKKRWNCSETRRSLLLRWQRCC